MPRSIHKLSDAACRGAKATTATRKLFDGGGLYLEVLPTGARYWRLKYRFAGKERRLALGVYPQIKLADARTAADKARKLLADGTDPMAHKRERAAAALISASNTFGSVAEEWYAAREKVWAPSHTVTVRARLDRDVLPWLAKRPVANIDAAEVLALLRRVEARGAIETAHRIKTVCAQVFAYAIATRRARSNPAAELKGALRPVKPVPMAAITDPKEVGALLRAIDGYQGSLVTRCALRLAPLLFSRPGNLRAMRWEDVDLEKREWRIPAEEMKGRIAHIVPLSKQAVVAMEEIAPLTRSGIYVFPGARTRGRPMSENTLSAALRRLGYDGDTMTPHGFRSIASTILNEQGWNRDAIERQLAHIDGNKVRAAYNRAEHLPERRKMMQAWADHLDELRQTNAASAANDLSGAGS